MVLPTQIRRPNRTAPPSSLVQAASNHPRRLAQPSSNLRTSIPWRHDLVCNWVGDNRTSASQIAWIRAISVTRDHFPLLQRVLRLSWPATHEIFQPAQYLMDPTDLISHLLLQPTDFLPDLRDLLRRQGLHHFLHRRQPLLCGNQPLRLCRFGRHGSYSSDTSLENRLKNSQRSYGHRTISRATTGKTHFSMTYGVEAVLTMKIETLTLRTVAYEDDANVEAMNGET
ncbi:hypothetical protein L484_002941 [Morus notabilis]|uniref:Uncharacterized protein n=1 Tax=Morus notabilis TaxID=981085 RepID=W9QTQ0_9ROSA|nr:hypothetical protein L484_002941 [Morus notabilis]